MTRILPHLPALTVVVPLIAALLAGLLRRGTIAFWLTLLVCWLLPVITIALMAQVMAHGPVTYAMGGWDPPWGIAYRVDLLNGFVLVLVSMVAAVIMPFARRSVAHEIEADRQAWFYCMFLLCLTGLLGITVTGDAFNAFVFMEISSLSTYVLIALGRDRRALVASFQYLIMGTIGATFYVIGVGLLYVVTGTLNMVDLAERLGPVMADQSRTVMTALAFLVVGISLKLALFPLSTWLPGAYAFAPSMVTTFLSATATKVAVYLLVRMLFVVVGPAAGFIASPATDMIIALSVAAIFVASTIAVFRVDLKRMLAYSSLAQIGYITLGIGIANQAALTGGIVHLVNHAIGKAALFMAAGCIVYRTGSLSLGDLAGIGRRMPVTMAAFTIAGLALAGVPGTVGFISKWYLVVGALQDGSRLLAFLIVASSLITFVYIGHVLEVAWFRPPAIGVARATDPPPSMLLPLVALAGASIWFGLDTSLTAGIAGQVATMLLAPVP
ncbi:MAG: monovalent cation/H+ antiporter subunit D family protein [Acetobacteraceae bacterium]